MAGFMFFRLMKLTSTGVIGIDLGSHSVKAIAISIKRGIYRIDGAVEVLLPKGVIIDNQLERADKLSLIIKQLLAYFPHYYKHAAIAVTGTDVITKVMTMDAQLGSFALENYIKLAVEDELPFPLDDVFIDFETIGTNEEDPSLNNVLVSAARKDRVLLQVQCIEAAGLTTKIVDVANHTLIRAVDFISLPDDFDRAVIVLDIGASQMMLNILYQGNIIFSRSKNHGGDICTNMIAEHYGVSFEEAEQIKVTHNFPDDCDEKVLHPFINMTLDFLRFELRMFNSTPHQFDPTKVVLTGGGALTVGLVEAFQTALDMEVILAEFYSHFTFKHAEDGSRLERTSSKYMVALGLALRGVL
jgi:type IV pilus assembly protein PilM